MLRYFKLTERYFINNTLQDAGAVVQFDDDPKAGGMTPGKFMVPCDETGRELTAPAVQAKAPAVVRLASSVPPKKAESADDLM